MKNCTRTLLLGLVVIAVSTSSLNAQDWREPLVDPNVSFYDVQSDFYQDWGAKEAQMQQHTIDVATAANKFAVGRNAITPAPSMKGGYKQFKRWEYFMEPRVYPSGDMTLVSTTNERFMEYLQTNSDAMWQFQRSQPGGANRVGPPGNQLLSSTWTFAGPTGAPAGMGAGRINFVRFDPTVSTTLWAGAPAGGLWKSTNSGTSWTTVTDYLTVIGATDVAIDPSNTMNMYLATGDGDAGDTYSIGVLKSTDGGVTWNTTGLTWTVNQGRVISKLLINPSNPLIVMAFSNVGIWRTTNGGTSWTQVQTTNSFKDAEYKPGDPTTVYASGTRFWKSVDSGVTWTNTATGLPANTVVDRFAIAVTQDPTGTAYVYVLAGSAANDGFYGCYRSTDSGVTFTTRSTTPNLLGWSSTGADTGGQGWYDLAIAASPIARDVVIVGGVNIWRSTNGGTNWTINAHWTGTGAPYVHADVHDLIFVPGSGTAYYAGCDGGVFYTANSGGAWADRSSNLCIAQIYRIGMSASTLNYWITGHQDNGTNLKNGASYTATMGGDGMDCFVDRTNNNTMYGSQYSGSLNRTTNGGTNWNAIMTGLTGTAPWVTDWEQDPTTANTLYCGRTNMFRSTNQGTGWTQLTALPATPAGTVVDFRIAPSNNQIIYVARATGLFKTINAGTAWTTVTGTLPVGSATISRVDVHPNDPNHVVVTFSGYSTGNKVFESTNGGTSWTNISTGLPNLPTNCVRFMPGTTTLADAMYVGCDVGVYYRDNTFTSWQPYFTALPNVPIFDIEIYQPTGKVRAASYGRGVWEVDIYNPGTLAPIADFTANQTLICPGTPVNFTDMSSFTPTSWSWAFQGGTPATSTAQNPTGITWSAPGTYSVTLTATNINGSDAEVKTAYITVLSNAVTLPLVEGFQATFLPPNWTAKNINNDGLFWTQATTGAASTQSAMFDNYNYDVGGAQDEMWAPRLNLSSYATVSMTFDVAYARYSAPPYSDTLEIVASSDCGATWTSVYLKGGTILATAPDQTTPIFVPTAAQWRNEPVSLNAFAGQPSVIIAIRNRGRYGQAIYVDNINITGTVAALPNATFTASTTSVCAGTPVSFTSTSSGAPTSWTWTFPSGTPASATTQNVASVVWNTAGTYTVTHTATNVNGTGTTTQVITVLATPTVTTTASSSTICAGSSTTLTGSGASTYAWMPGSLTGTSVVVTPATTTTYTVTGTAANGCTGSTTRVITVNPLPTVTTTASSTTICSGNSTTLTGAGASTYAWMPGSLSGTSVVVSPAITTTYTVTGTDVNGCVNTATRTITVNPTPTVTATASSPTICAGSSTNLTGAGASTYAWMPGSLSGTTVSVTPATTTTYTVTGTAVNGCIATQTVLVTVTPSPTVTTTASSTTICSGNSTTITASGATTYSWMPGSLTGTSIVVSPATTTTYTVTGTTAGCTGTATRLITVNPSPTVTATASAPTICVGNSTNLTGSGASTYAWMPGSLSGTTVSVTPATTTTYTVTGTAVNGCTSTQTVLVTVTPLPTVTTSASSTTICNGSSTTITASGATTYSWMPGSLTGTSVVVSPAVTTTYTVTGTTAGCSGTTTQLITVNPTPTVTATASAPSICVGNSTNLSGSGASTYAWMPGSLSGTTVSVSPVVTTTYTVTGTAVNGCISTQTVLVTVTPGPTVTTSASSSTICDGNSTTITASGATTYAWMPGSLTGTSVVVSPTTTTTYTVTGTTAGCTGTATQLITVNPTPTVTVSASSSTICNGNTTTLTASGATTYSWMPGSLTGTSVVVSPAVTTSYTVTGTTVGCSNTATQVITVNPTPTVTATASSPTICSGSSTNLTASGASTYTWMPGSLSGTTVAVSPTTTTTYTVTGTAANGCISTQNVTVTVNASPTVTASASTTSICTGGSTTLTGSGASTYLWMPGSLTGSSVVVTPAVTTTYTVTGTAANGCTDVQTITITVGAQPTVTSSASSSSICAGSSTTLTAAGATTFTWMPGSLSGTSVIVTPAATTTYTVTGSNGPGCSNTSTLTVTVNALPTVTTSASSTTVCSGSPTTLTGAGASTYLWMPGSLTGTSVVVNPTVTTTYTVTGTSAAGCTNTATRTITVNALPTLTVTPVAPSICLGGSVNLVASVTGGCTYSWSPTVGLSAPTSSTTAASPTITTTYVMTKTRTTTGCSNTASVVVTVNPSPTVTATASSTSICTGNTVTITSSGASTYVWNPGPMTGPSVSVSPNVTTTYTVIGTGSNGCTSSQTITITVGAQPTVTASSSSSAICNGNSVTLTGSGTTTYNWMPGSLSGTSVSVSPTVNTTYTVTGSNGPGCSNTATVSVVVNALPTVSASSSGSVCAGDLVTLTGSGASTYAWMPGSLSGSPVTDAPASSTTYTVTGTDINGCSNTATVAVNVNTLPTVSASSSGDICAGNLVTLTGSGASTYAWMPGSLSGSPVTDAPASSTTYTVTGTDINGCSNASTVVVNVNALPTVGASSSGTICAGDLVTLTGSGASTYAWMPGSLSGSPVTDAPASSTTYTVTGTDINGCSNTATTSVNVNPTPTVTLTLAIDTACDIDGPTPLSGGAPAGGNYTGPGVTANNFDASSVGAGTYAIVYTYVDGNGCTDSATQNIVVDVCSGIPIDAGISTLSVVPNPNNGEFILSFFAANSDDYVLEIHNALGQILYVEQLNTFSGQYSKEISLSEYEKGLYTIRLRSSDKESVIRMITY